jgi:phage-related protein
MPHKCLVYYYLSATEDNPIKDFLDSLEVSQQVKLLRIIKYIQEFGLSAVLPHIKKLQGVPLWEIRTLGKDNLRILYVVPYKNTVLLLHGFSKKAQKTPAREIRIALIRFEDWKKRSR